MYQQHFQLDSQPFTAAPFAKHYFPATAIQQTLETASQCIERSMGPVIVIGEVGMGKSLLLTMLEERFQDEFHVANLACARLDERQELLQSILFELDLPYSNMPEGELRLSLIEYLKPRSQCPEGVLLLVDEAQKLSVELLDELRLITNLVRDGQPRVRIVMAGTPRLEDRLNDIRLESFNQRIAAQCYLTRLASHETVDYVVHQINQAGGNGTSIFPPNSLKRIHQLTDGCPRSINQLCDQALIRCLAKGSLSVSQECVEESWKAIEALSGTLLASDPSDKSSSGSQETLSGDSDWSVVEFGELDSDPSSQTDSTFSFETSNTLSETSDSLTPVAESQPDPIIGPEGTPENSSEFPGPFNEPFEMVEEVVDRYVPLVVEQNRSATHLTQNDLGCIESDVESDSEFTSEPLDESVSCETINMEPDEQQLPIAITSEELAFSEPGTIQYESATPIGPQETIIPESSDDRDLIVVSRTNQRPDKKPVQEEPIPFPATAVSTGQAVRMEYNQLFEQLRSTNYSG